MTIRSWVGTGGLSWAVPGLCGLPGWLANGVLGGRSQKTLTTENAEDHGGPRRSANESDDETTEAVFEPGGMEIDQETDAYSTHSEIGQDLGFMGWQQGGNGFDFKNDGVFDDDVSAEPQWDRGAFVNDGYRDLALKANVGMFQLQAPCIHIDGFKKARPNGPVYVDRESNDAFRQLVVLEHILLRAFSVVLGVLSR